MPLRHPPSQSFDEVVVIDSPSPCLPSRTLPNPIAFHSDPTEVIDLDMSPTPALDDHHAPRKRRRRDHSSPDSSRLAAVIDVDAADDNPSPPPGPSVHTRLQPSTSQRPVTIDPTTPQHSTHVPSRQGITRRDSTMSDDVIETAASGPRLSAQNRTPATAGPSHDLDLITPVVDQVSAGTPSVEIVDSPPRSTNPSPSNQHVRRSMPSLAPTAPITSIDSSIEPVDGHTRSGNSSPHAISDTSTPRSSGSLLNPVGPDGIIQPYVVSALPRPSTGASAGHSVRRSTRRVIVPVYDIRGVAGSTTAFTGLRSGPGGVPVPTQRGPNNRFTPVEEIELMLRESIDGAPTPRQSASAQRLNESGNTGTGGRRLRHDPEVEIMETGRNVNVSSQGTPAQIATFSIGSGRRLDIRASPTPPPANTPQEVHVALPSGSTPTFVVGRSAGSAERENPRTRLRSRGGLSRRASDVRSMMHEMQQQIQEIREQIPVIEESYRRHNSTAQGRTTWRLGNGRGSSGAGPSNAVGSGLYYPVRPIQTRRRNGRSSVTASGGSRVRLGTQLHQVLFRDRLHAHPEMHLRLFQQFGGDQHLDYENLVRLDEQLLREKNRAEKEQIDSLPVQKATAADKEIRCCVCMCDVEVGEELRVLPCNHKFHKSCIDEWLTYNGCCPICKKRIGPPRSRRRVDARRDGQQGNQ